MASRGMDVRDFPSKISVNLPQGGKVLLKYPGGVIVLLIKSWGNDLSNYYPRGDCLPLITSRG